MPKIGKSKERKKISGIGSKDVDWLQMSKRDLSEVMSISETELMIAVQLYKFTKIHYKNRWILCV